MHRRLCIFNDFSLFKIEFVFPLDIRLILYNKVIACTLCERCGGGSDILWREICNRTLTIARNVQVQAVLYPSWMRVAHLKKKEKTRMETERERAGEMGARAGARNM